MNKKHFCDKYEENKKEYYKYFDYSKDFDTTFDDEIEMQKRLPYTVDERIMYSILHLQNFKITEAKSEYYKNIIEKALDYIDRRFEETKDLEDAIDDDELEEVYNILKEVKKI